MSLQERTLVVRNFDPERTTVKLLKELCTQAGPVKNVVVKPDHAFVEYEDIESVGYARALLDGVQLFQRTLSMEPKLRSPIYNRYKKMLDDYVEHDRRRQEFAERQARDIIRQDQVDSQAPINVTLAQQPPPQVNPMPTHQQFQPQINYAHQPEPTIFEANPFIVHQSYQQPPIQLNQQYWQPPPQVIPVQQYPNQPSFYVPYPMQNIPQQPGFQALPNFDQFRPHVPKDLGKRPWSDKDRWNRRR